MDAKAFADGLDALKTQDYRGAARDFDLVVKSIDVHDKQYNRMESYLGLAKVLTNDDSGMLLCRDAASSELTYGDVFLNAACAEWYCKQRKRAIDAARKGLQVDSTHKQLNKLISMMDSRKSSVIGFLHRNHIINRLLGRLLRRKNAEITVHTLLY